MSNQNCGDMSDVPEHTLDALKKAQTNAPLPVGESELEKSVLVLVAMTATAMQDSINGCLKDGRKDAADALIPCFYLVRTLSYHIELLFHPRGMAAKHYLDPRFSQPNFDKAVKWLGKQYGLN